MSSNKYDGKCLSCDNCDQKSTGSLRCTKYGEYVSIDSPSGRCYSYKKALYRSDSDIERMIRNYGRYFILTKIDNIYKLNGKSLNNEYFKSFKKIFDEILPQTEKGQSIKNSYNLIGPIIADKIDEEYANPEKKDRLMFDLEKYYERIIKCANGLVKDRKFDAAVECYKTLVDSFCVRYNLVYISFKEDEEVLNNRDEKPYGRTRSRDYNYSKLHGNKRKK